MSPNELVELGTEILPVARVCELLDVPRSSYYERRSRRPSRRALVNAVLTAQIRAAFKRSHRRYGSPRITRALRNRNVRVSRKHVARLMRADGLVARPKKRFRVTTQSDHDHPIAPNLLERDFTPRHPIGFGLATSPTFGPWKAGCIWPFSSTCTRGASSAGR